MDKIYSDARGIDSKTMSLQYFDILKQLGSSPSTKFIFPMEFTEVLKPFMSMASESPQDSDQRDGN